MVRKFNAGFTHKDIEKEISFWNSWGVVGAQCLLEKTVCCEDVAFLHFVSDMLAAAGPEILPLLKEYIVTHDSIDQVVMILQAISKIGEDNSVNDDSWKDIIISYLESPDIELREAAPYATRVLSDEAAYQVLTVHLAKENDDFLKRITEDALRRYSFL